METMETFTEVKFELSERQELINKLNDDNEQIYSLCRTLLDCVKQSMRNRPNCRSYEQKSAMKQHTKDLCLRIDNKVEIHDKCQEDLINYEQQENQDYKDRDIEVLTQD